MSAPATPLAAGSPERIGEQQQHAGAALPTPGGSRRRPSQASCSRAAPAARAAGGDRSRTPKRPRDVQPSARRGLRALLLSALVALAGCVADATPPAAAPATDPSAAPTAAPAALPPIVFS